MNTHEYQAKEILKRYNVPIPLFGVAHRLEEVDKLIKHFQWKEAVLKIQVHAGGRGKAGGVKLCHSVDEILSTATRLLGMKMVNQQTGPEGVIAHQIMVTQPVSIAKEYYLGIVIDRAVAQPILIASPEGGVEIEEIAEKHPDKILKLPIELDGTIRGYRLVRLAQFMGWDKEVAKEGILIAQAIAKAFMDTDASLLEINPLVLSTEGRLLALDAKLAIDDNALYRQPQIEAYYDVTQVSPGEAAAKEFDLAYIALEGNIGCMVNGAGLAMATMDIIQYYGGKPANFLDVGGGASKEKVAAGFKIILSDPRVQAILVNIFGGIMDCAVLAEGIIAAASEMSIKVPLVVRMEGTNVERGKELLKQSGLAITAVDGLADAAESVCKTLKK